MTFTKYLKKLSSSIYKKKTLEKSSFSFSVKEHQISSKSVSIVY
jgi:hypothetical protein